MKVTLKSLETIKERISHVELPWEDGMVHLVIHEQLNENDEVLDAWIQETECEGPSFILDAGSKERFAILKAVEEYYKQQVSLKKEGIEVILKAYKKATREDYNYAGD
jgi:hypothetical protein